MSTVKEVLDRQKEVTDRISSQVRTLALSFLAVIWLFLIPGQDTPVLPHPLNNGLLMGAGATALLAMVIDFGHYVAAYLSVQHTLNSIPEGQDVEKFTFEYDYSLFRYRAQYWCFWGKQLLVAVSFILLAVAFWGAFFGC